MSDCCSPSGYRRLFNTREAQRRLKRYRRRGLDGMAQRMVDHLVARGVEGRSVLEVGGGVGGLHLELLAAGAAAAVNVELSGGYEQAAAQLLAERGATERVTRMVADFAESGDEIEPADDVVMNRVVCCYPYMEKLMNAAMTRTGRFLALTFPRDRWFTRWAVRMGNWYLRRRRVEFQTYVHPPEAIIATAESAGFAVSLDHEDLIWRAVVFERAA